GESVPPPLTEEGELHTLPGPLVGLLERAAQELALRRRVVAEEADEVVETLRRHLLQGECEDVLEEHGSISLATAAADAKPQAAQSRAGESGDCRQLARGQRLK